MKEEDGVSMTPIDIIACGSNLQMLKALLPYLKQENQMNLAVLVKIMEIQNLMSFFRDTGNMQAQSLQREPVSSLEMLRDISAYFPASQRERLNQGLQMMEMMEMLKGFQNQTGEEGQEDFLKTMLSPEQQSMFETYQSMFSEQESGKEPQ